MTARQVGLTGCRTVVDVLRRVAQQRPDVEAYVEPAHTGRVVMRFAEWDARADGVAGLLADRGVGRGDVVTVLLGSGIAYAVCYAAALRLGAITTGLNPRMGPTEMRSVLERCRPAATVVDGGLPATLAAGVPVGAVIERAEVEAAYQDTAPPLPRLYPEDPVAVVWTSGTTGLPKGAVFTHQNLEAVARGTDVLSQVGDRRLSPLPFAHVGYMTRVWDEIERAVTTVLTPAPWQAGEALRLMEAERITVGQGVPTQWRLVLDRPELDTTDLSALRIAGTGAARVPAELVAEMRARLGVPVVVRYTSTEASLGTGTRPGDPDHVVATTVGRPVAGVELRIVNGDGRPVPTGTVGRVQLRSGAVMAGYFAGRDAAAASASAPGPDAPVPVSALIDPVATASTRAPDGWVTMGDFGSVDDDGDLRLAGREHERYIRGGYNVYPAEVEEVLGSHPALSQAAVVGAPDPVLGEVGVAFVVVEADAELPSLEELREHCRSRLADYKAPDMVVPLAALPLTPMMKVDKQRLADPAAAAAEERSRRFERRWSSATACTDPEEARRPAVPVASREREQEHEPNRPDR